MLSKGGSLYLVWRGGAGWRAWRGGGRIEPILSRKLPGPCTWPPNCAPSRSVSPPSSSTVPVQDPGVTPHPRGQAASMPPRPRSERTLLRAQRSPVLTGLPLGPSSPGGPLGPGGPAAPEGPDSPFSPLSPLGPCGERRGVCSQSQPAARHALAPHGVEAP